MSERALERFVLRARRAVGIKGIVNVLVTSSAEVKRLNGQFRQKNKATDVLSFPAPVVRGERRSAQAGDVAISADIASENAVALGHAPAEEVKILALHGVLHLAGFDHERDSGQMARKESALRRKLRLPAGLIERTMRKDGVREGRSKA